ncbi:MAG: bifunctional precorrin-2 dehydrogenase/sirohydrochlorin ferrochelatase [Sulfuricurvum sp.]|jgi:precorrin-2 dehydrogenase/sirohydrochlorin ferrochelatase|uniref:precorrin-2 dehydrogenase/sirohydrochlorin ferrochelatase family protein n=1 Tax=Sulfuricurvum sp. TaxID=2025608 RepID=UPI0025EBBB55|nr:bifunctional precorrin-2 dehydrogenase/sirohydrochlorin ferrochelatase [Sulfuricurvum sp.]MCK9372327.1 bifunctional precorrin-2 dehydrogenase/sirohydrochlorin ferrochelatase [Sulfuricurvum sp.]
MADSHYLPVMLDLRKKKILLVGGGEIACEKLSRLVDCTDDITIVATECSPKMEEYIRANGFSAYRRVFEESDLEGMDIVIAAVDSLQLQAEIFEKASQRKILCNAVDLPSYCHFIFPSIIRRDDLVIAISTSGASPAIAKHMKRFIDNLIPSDIGSFLTMMRERRKELPKGKERMRYLDQLASEYMSGAAQCALQRLREVFSKSP